MSFITAIGTANPENRFSQSLIAGFMLRTMDLHNGDARKLKAIFRASGIAYRHSVVEDYGRDKNFTFFPDTNNLEPFPSTEKRLQIFRQHALALSVSSFRDMMSTFDGIDVREITHLIVEKLLLTPTEQLKAVSDEAMVVAYADALNRLFRLAAEREQQSPPSAGKREVPS